MSQYSVSVVIVCAYCISGQALCGVYRKYMDEDDCASDVRCSRHDRKAAFSVKSGCFALQFKRLWFSSNKGWCANTQHHQLASPIYAVHMRVPHKS